MPQTELIINFATRGREAQFLKSLHNITNSIHTKSYRIIVSADENDHVMNCERMREYIASFPNTEIYYGPQTSKVGAINATTKYFGEFYWLINHSDDMIYKVMYWDKKMLDQIKETWGDSTDFFAHFSDGHTHEKLPTLNVCGYEYFKRFGYIYHWSYNSVSCDAENFHVSNLLGRYKYFPDIYFEHHHPANVPSMQVDATYRGNDKFGNDDTATYFDRMSHGFYIENPVFIPDEVKYYMDKRTAVK